MKEASTLLGNSESPARLLLRLPICERSVTTELNHEFTLPDYLPEIRKMLRVNATILPPESYTSASSIEFSGKLLYRVLYTGADGQLWSATLPEEYTFALPFELPASCDLSMGIDAFASSIPDLAVTRALSPRKIGIRFRMKSNVRAYGFHSLEESFSGSPYGRIERLTGECDAAVILRGTEPEIEFSDELFLPSGGADSVRVIGGDGEVFVSEAVADQNQVILRGELLLKLLTVTESASDAPNLPTVTLRKIPFSLPVRIDGADRYCDACGYGRVADLSILTQDGRILSDIKVTFTAECQKNRRFSYTRDAFSTGASCENEYSTTALPYALHAQNANFTLSDSIPLDGNGISPSARILDVTGDLAPDAVTESDGKLLFTGNAHFSVLTIDPESGEYGYGDITVPFRYTADRAGTSEALPKLSTCDVSMSPVSIRLRSDGQTLSLDAEISVAYRTEGKTEIRHLTMTRFGDPIAPPKGCMILSYPAPKSTLWDTAKKYRTALSALSEQNGLSIAPDAPLDGVRVLVVKE